MADDARLREIRAWLATGENDDPSCLSCNEHVLLAHIDALAERLEAAEARSAAAEAAIEENTCHEVEEYTGTCLPNCWRCALGGAER